MICWPKHFYEKFIVKFRGYSTQFRKNTAHRRAAIIRSDYKFLKQRHGSDGERPPHPVQENGQCTEPPSSLLCQGPSKALGPVLPHLELLWTCCISDAQRKVKTGTGENYRYGLWGSVGKGSLQRGGGGTDPTHSQENSERHWKFVTVRAGCWSLSNPSIKIGRGNW